MAYSKAKIENRMGDLLETKARLEKKLAGNNPRYAAVSGVLKERLVGINRSLEFWTGELKKLGPVH